MANYSRPTQSKVQQRVNQRVSFITSYIYNIFSRQYFTVSTKSKSLRIEINKPHGVGIALPTNRLSTRVDASSWSYSSFQSIGNGVEDKRPNGQNTSQIYPTFSSNAVQPVKVNDLTFVSLPCHSVNYENLVPERKSGQIYPIVNGPSYIKNDSILYGHSSISTIIQTTAILTYPKKITTDGSAIIALFADVIFGIRRKIVAQGIFTQVNGSPIYKIVYNLPADGFIQASYGMNSIVLFNRAIVGASLNQALITTYANMDYGNYYNDWVAQNYGWNHDFNLDWWAD